MEMNKEEQRFWTANNHWKLLIRGNAPLNLQLHAMQLAGKRLKVLVYIHLARQICKN